MEKQPKILLPKPYPEYIKSKSIHRKLDLLSESLTIREWIPIAIMTDMYYLYLFNKYKTNCLIRSKNVSLGLAIIINEMSQNEKNNQREHLEDIANKLANCIKRNIDTIVIPLSIKDKQFGWHANVLIYRRNDNVIEHFEPHGKLYSGKYAHNSNKIIHKDLNDFRDILNKLLEKDGKQPVELIKATDVCPMLEGLQNIEAEFIRLKDIQEGGYCAAWSMFFTELALKNPTIPSNQLLTIVYDKLEDMPRSSASKYLRDVIRGYVNLIYEKIDKYLSLILGENRSLNKIIEAFTPFLI